MTNQMPAVEVYTDGACMPNPGPGGWGVLLRCGQYEKELCGGEPAQTTNNRMELLAAIRALESLTRPSTVTVFTDSTYVRDGITKWLPGWRANGWRTSSGGPVKNVDLWQQLDELAKNHSIEWRWVRAHVGHQDNERADRLANLGLQEAITATV